MTIEAVIARRGIREVLHFTTHQGILGILDCRAVRPRAALKRSERLEHILRMNTRREYDPEWKSFVNLSITRINGTLFDISSIHWHPDVWWVVLSFDPIIMAHPGVYFSTTNNAYPATRRARRSKGLEALFARRVYGRFGTVIARTPETPDNHTTCPQAEVLYPGELSTDWLQRIYVKTEEDRDDVHGMLAAVSHRTIDVVVDAGKFGA